MLAQYFVAVGAAGDRAAKLLSAMAAPFQTPQQPCLVRVVQT
jgi:hypothetical protein